MSPTTTRTTPRGRVGSTAANDAPAATSGETTARASHAEDDARGSTGAAPIDDGDDTQTRGVPAEIRSRRRRLSPRGVGRAVWVVATYGSLLCCAGAAVFWARSLVSGEGLIVAHHTTRATVSSNAGLVIVTFQRMSFDTPRAELRYKDWSDPSGMVPWNRWRFHVQNENNVTPPIQDAPLGFAFYAGTGSAPTFSNLRGTNWRRVVLQSPHWAILLLTGIVPGLRLWRVHRVRRDRVARGLCRKCGFPLGEVYHSCPECGERRPLAA